jgi:hypothetical protein
MKLIKIGDKYLIERGFFHKEYLDMSSDMSFYWWSRIYADQYSGALTEEQALNQLKKYREYVLAEKRLTELQQLSGGYDESK